MYSSVAFLLVLLIFLHACCGNVLCQQNEEAVILNGPDTQVVAPGSIVYFVCHAQGNSVNWYINGSYADQSHAAKGFNVSYTQISGNSNELGEYNNTIVVEAHPFNNNTIVSCIATANVHGQQALQEGTLIIAGPPLAPSLDLNIEYIDDNVLVFNLTWSAPFTWNNFPIISYTITIVLTNYSDQREAINVEMFNITGTQGHQYRHNINKGKECYVVNFSIVATNSIGNGEYSSVQYSNSIEVGEIENIETTVKFLSNGTPNFWMSFLVPNMCPRYQVGIYNITIYDDNNHNIVHYFVPTEYTQKNIQEQELIVKEVKSGLIVGGYYIVEVTVETGGVVRSQNKTFDTLFNSLTCTGKDKISSLSPCLPCTRPVSKGSKYWTVVGTILGIAFLSIICLLLVIIIILVVLLAWKKKLSKCGNDSDLAKAKPRRKKARSTVHNVVNNNPIYEGVVYETTPGESFKPLLIPSSAPSLNGAGSAPNYHDTPPVLNLPPSIPTDRECAQPYLVPMNEVERIKTSIKQAELSQRSQCGDEYMVMGSNNPKDSNFEKMPLSEGSVVVSEMAVSGHDSEDTYVTLH